KKEAKVKLVELADALDAVPDKILPTLRELSTLLQHADHALEMFSSANAAPALQAMDATLSVLPTVVEQLRHAAASIDSSIDEHGVYLAIAERLESFQPR